VVVLETTQRGALVIQACGACALQHPRLVRRYTRGAPLRVHGATFENMQIRLATMHDLLHRIAGDSAEEQHELLMKLVAEVGARKRRGRLYSSSVFLLRRPNHQRAAAIRGQMLRDAEIAFKRGERAQRAGRFHTGRRKIYL
jgi:hypothetical protein